MITARGTVAKGVERAGGSPNIFSVERWIMVLCRTVLSYGGESPYVSRLFYSSGKAEISMWRTDNNAGDSRP